MIELTQYWLSTFDYVIDLRAIVRYTNIQFSEWSSKCLRRISGYNFLSHAGCASDIFQEHKVQMKR